MDVQLERECSSRVAYNTHRTNSMDENEKQKFRQDHVDLARFPASFPNAFLLNRFCNLETISVDATKKEPSAVSINTNTLKNYCDGDSRVQSHHYKDKSTEPLLQSQESTGRLLKCMSCPLLDDMIIRFIHSIQEAPS
mmetsp:Transcript_8990/g.16954  ORF Transcript_8990/g.16954 Transcript_8990/m.16954 type:complete len:138 (+) Transcript_8990:125-538(+)